VEEHKPANPTQLYTERHTMTHTQPFYSPFSGTTQVRRCQKKTSSGFYDAREDNRGRHTDHPAGCHSIQATHLRHSPFFTLDASTASLPLYPGLGQAPNMLACVPSGVVLFRPENGQQNVLCVLLCRC